MNMYLKDIAKLAGIAKFLTYHLARHSFATSVTLNNDVPIESVSRMMGHKTLKQTQHYAKVIKQESKRRHADTPDENDQSSPPRKQSTTQYFIKLIIIKWKLYKAYKTEFMN